MLAHFALTVISSLLQKKCSRTVVPVSTACSELTPRRLDSLVAQRPTDEVTAGGTETKGVTVAFVDGDSVCLLPVTNSILPPVLDVNERDQAIESS